MPDSYRTDHFGVLDILPALLHAPRKFILNVQVDQEVNEPAATKLQEEIHELRSLVVSLSSALLRKIAVEFLAYRDAERLVSEADNCFRTAKMPGLKSEIAEGLEVAGHELMALAVEIDTRRDRAKRKNKIRRPGRRKR